MSAEGLDVEAPVDGVHELARGLLLDEKVVDIVLLLVPRLRYFYVVVLVGAALELGLENYDLRS